MYGKKKKQAVSKDFKSGKTILVNTIPLNRNPPTPCSNMLQQDNCQRFCSIFISYFGLKITFTQCNAIFYFYYFFFLKLPTKKRCFCFFFCFNTLIHWIFVVNSGSVTFSFYFFYDFRFVVFFFLFSSLFIYFVCVCVIFFNHLTSIHRQAVVP